MLRLHLLSYQGGPRVIVVLWSGWEMYRQRVFVVSVSQGTFGKTNTKMRWENAIICFFAETKIYGRVGNFLPKQDFVGSCMCLKFEGFSSFCTQCSKYLVE